jgi:hypothetical protein
MATLFVRHTVADYNFWRKRFDEFQPIGAEHGVKSAAVYQAVDNPNDVTVTHDFDTVEAAGIVGPKPATLELWKKLDAPRPADAK